MNWINAYKKKPQAGKDVLAMDYMGIFFIGYVDADGNWWISCYDDVDKELDTTNIEVHRWCEIKPPKRGFFYRILHLKCKIKKWNMDSGLFSLFAYVGEKFDKPKKN